MLERIAAWLRDWRGVIAEIRLVDYTDYPLSGDQVGRLY